MSAATVATVCGDVPAGDLGIVASHEHLLYGLPGWQHAPEVELDRAAAFEQLLARLEEFKRLGGRTLVDASGISLGRNVPLYRRLSEVSGVNIVAATGFDSQETSIPTHFRLIGFFYRGQGPLQWKRAIPGHFAPSHSGSKEYLMFLFYNELTEGMAAPSMIRSLAKAGLVRTGAGGDRLTPVEELAIRGAAMAARKAGLPVFTSRQGQGQLELLLAEGLAPGRIVIGHCDDARAVDAQRDRRFAERGAYVAYDHIGWERDAAHAMPDEERVALAKGMVDAGFAERVVLSCSAIGIGLGTPRSSHGYAHLLREFVPRLQKAGVAEAAIETMLVANPKRLLSPLAPETV
ncbi:MAG: hypothetical protein A3G80_08050 [Betaproteobacteria bacterium RIFCSPLOWO2_12_FULL_62_13b]|nr:MAG: hypothetical protein A3G80_08050 [Betaproteobacteria bacterium RIFCSPLOWO2_12_FULL_62_13b]